MLNIHKKFKTFFIGTDSRIKPLLKAFMFLFAYLFISALCVLGFAQFLPKQWFWFAWGSSTSIAVLFLWRRFLKKDGQSFPDPWINPDHYTLGRFFFGFGIGLTILLLTTGLLIYLLPLKLVWVKNSNWLSVLAWSSALVFCAFHEELGFRSYFLKRLQKQKGIWVSQGIIAIAFALYHIAGGQDVLNSLLSTSLWSVIFGLAAVYSRGLAFSTGIHAASTVGQAVLGMKIQEGFNAILTLQPTRIMPANVPAVVLASQALVLLVVIVLFGMLAKKKHSFHPAQQI